MRRLDVGQARANRTEEFQEVLTDGTAVTGNVLTELPEPRGNHMPRGRVAGLAPLFWSKLKSGYLKAWRGPLALSSGTGGSQAIFRGAGLPE